MKTVNDLPQEIKEKTDEQIKAEIDILQNELESRKMFVPKEVGIKFCWNDTLGIIFNNGKSLFSYDNGFYRVLINNNKIWDSTSAGNNIQLIETTFGEVEEGDLFLNELKYKDSIHHYSIKIEKKGWFASSDKEILNEKIDKDTKVYKLKLIE